MDITEANRFSGISLVVAATLFFSIMDAIAKNLVQSYSVINITCVRYVIQVFLLIIICGFHLGKNLFTTEFFFIQVTRGFLIVGISITFFVSLKYLPLADATAITFISPILTLVLALFLLKEKIMPRLWIAVFFGMIGVIAIIKPTGVFFSPITLLPVLTAILYSAYEVLTKKISGTESPYTSLFYSAMVGALISSLVLPLTWQTPNLQQSFLLISLSVVGLLAHYFLILSLKYVSVSTIQPYHYLSLAWASLIGYLVFNEIPDSLSVLGILVIGFSGIIAVKLESRK